jgi:hypothetical protein
MIGFLRLALGPLAASAAVFGATGFAGTASAQTGTATVTVVHGVPGVTVDVCANGSPAIPGFTFKSQKTLSLPAGTLSLGIVRAGQTCRPANYLASASATLTAGEDTPVIAYLNASGTPTLGAYANNTAAVPAGQGRLVLSHNADARGVNVLAGSTPLAAGLTTGTGLGMPTSVVTDNSPVGSHRDLPLAGLAALLAVARLGPWDRPRPSAPPGPHADPSTPGPGNGIQSKWRLSGPPTPGRATGAPPWPAWHSRAPWPPGQSAPGSPGEPPMPSA